MDDRSTRPGRLQEGKTLLPRWWAHTRWVCMELAPFHGHQGSLYISGKILRSERRPDLLKTQRSLEDLMRTMPITILSSRTMLGTCQESDLEPGRAQEWRLRPGLCPEVFVLWHWWWLGWWALGINVALDILVPTNCDVSEACGITSTRLALCGDHSTW